MTSVCAISEDNPVIITLAPMSRDASTVCTRWFATVESIVGTPVISTTTTFARLFRIPRSSCSVNCLARCESITPMIGRISSRSRTCKTGVDNSRIASCCCRITRSRSCTKLTATVFAMRFDAGSYASSTWFSKSKSAWYFLNSERASTSRNSSTIPTTSLVSTPRGMMRSERLRA